MICFSVWDQEHSRIGTLDLSKSPVKSLLTKKHKQNISMINKYLTQRKSIPT